MKRHPTNSASSVALLRSLLFLACLFCMGTALAESDEDPSRIWIDRPWEYRYVIYIESPSAYERLKRFEEKENAKSKEINFYRLEPLFPLSVSMMTDPDGYRGEDMGIGAIVVQFDKGGWVTTPNLQSLRLRGRISRPLPIVLSAGDQPDSWWFLFGYWYTGQSGYEQAYTPAICEADEIPWFQSKHGRYTKGFAADKLDQLGNFGCREWSYYLQSDKHHYIDVTSYGKDKTTYIRPILGWGRFDIAPKPVIGKHGSVWVCLHECPNGEAPGIIPDIKAWAKANNWPVPKPPKKQPMFPDRPYKPGEFID